LHIMGGIDDQEYADECFSLADKMDLGDCLLFTGRVNIREYMKKIDFKKVFHLLKQAEDLAEQLTAVRERLEK